MTITYSPIGIVKTPFKSLENMPIQPKGALGIKGSIEVKKEFSEGLKDLEGFSHIILLYHLHKSDNYKLNVKPFLDNKIRGVFATRAPRRPNSIGLSIVKLIDIKGNILYIENCDILHGTPLLDIKPYIPLFDHFETEKNGWTDNKEIKLENIRSDNRFKEH